MENISLLKSNRIIIEDYDGRWPVVAFPHIEEIYAGYHHLIQLYSVKNMEHQLKQIYKVTPMEYDDYIIDIVKMEVTDELCVLTGEGAIYKLSSPDENFDDWELVGNMDAAVDAASWNFDVSTLAVISLDGYLTLIGRYFDVVANVSVNTIEFGESRNISLGWGKTSTQFVGQGVRPISNKNSADAQSQTPQLMDYYDNKRSIISWRGDGKFLATSNWCTIENRRKIRVWSDQGLLHSTCDLNVFLEPVLSWKPNGICISTTAIPFANKDNDKTSNRTRNMVFFERNGLRHGGFQLVNCDINSTVKTIQWNIDSTMLAVVIDNLAPTNTQLLQIWISSNYHYYLKYETVLDITPNSFKIENIVWYSTNCLLLLGSDGTMIRYQYTPRVDVSVNNVIAVVDGTHIQFTPLSSTVIPLPYSLSGCRLSYFPNEIIYINQMMIDTNSSGKSEWVLALLKDGTEMNIIEIDIGRRGCIDPRSEKGCIVHNAVVVVDDELLNGSINYANSQLRKVIVIGRQRMFALFNNGKQDSFCMIEFSTKNTMFHCEISSAEITLNQNLRNFDLKKYKIIRFIQPKQFDYSTPISFIYAECENNSLLRIDFSSDDSCKVQITYLHDIPYQTNDSVILVDSKRNNKSIFIYTDIVNNLYVNENQRLFQFCSSFYVSHEFLLAVTKMENLHCIPLKLLWEMNDNNNEKLDSFSNKITTDSNNSNYSYNRIVETGAKILCSSEVDASLILQIPRGNIELIYPRPLVISKLKNLLQDRVYNEAVYLVRKHRLDFNLIFDHDPLLLLKSIDLFIEQISNPTLLNVVLNEISSIDTTETTYKDFYNNKIKSLGWNPAEKMSFFMKGFRSCLETLLDKQFNSDHFNSILLTYMKENKELGYQQALFCIRDMILCSKNHVNVKNNENLVVNSLQFIKQHLQDDNLFYQQALGSYDLDLVVKVAEVVNKDPQEYLPFINDLREYVDTDPNYMRYLIDCYLQHYDDALLHLLKCEDKFDECVAFVVKHQKYKMAINNLAPCPQHYNTISRMYAEFLYNEKKAYQDASIVYQRLGIFNKAFECCLKVKKFQHLHFKNCVGFLNKLIGGDGNKSIIFSKQQFSKYQNALLDKLIYTSNFDDAIEFVDLYMNDGDRAFRMALDYHIWDSVVYLSYKADPYDTKHGDDLIRLTIQKRCETLRTFVENKVELFKHLYNQLLDYRTNIAELMSTLPEMNMDDLQSLDGASMTSSMSQNSGTSSNRSSSTTSTQRTITKNRKKLTKKYFVTRNGSVYEQFAVMESLANLYDDYIRFKDECCKLLPLMVTYGVNDLAKSLQSSLVEWRELLILNFSNIWTTRQYLGPVRKDQHFPDPHRPQYKTLNSESNPSPSNYDVDTFLESLTPLISVPNISKIKDISFFNKNLI